MRKTRVFAAGVTLSCALLAGCSDPADSPSAPAPPNTNAATPVVPVPAREATPQIVRGRLRFIDGYRAGLEAAAAQRKPMLLFFTAAWCGYCHQLAADAFTDESVVSLSEQFVCVLIDADREPEVCQQFQVSGYPTIQFVSTRGQPLNRMVGKRPGHVLVRQMHAALQGLARAGVDGTTTR
ncbi:MAG: thioredoxin family protein [Pirellulales bacterium]